MGRRTRLDIIYDILNAIKTKGGKIKPTHLMYKANMSHQSLGRYLDELEAKEMVGTMDEGGQKYYTVTEKGDDFLNEFKKLQQFEQTFGL